MTQEPERLMGPSRGHRAAPTVRKRVKPSGWSSAIGAGSIPWGPDPGEKSSARRPRPTVRLRGRRRTSRPSRRPRRRGTAAAEVSRRRRPLSRLPSQRKTPEETAAELQACGRGQALRAEARRCGPNSTSAPHDLQRVTAEYANYRKRVDRDRGVGRRAGGGPRCSPRCCRSSTTWTGRGSTATSSDRSARLPSSSSRSLASSGWPPSGRRATRFDPNRHEAVRTSTSADVTESTCVEVMRRGYLMGERLLRAAMVAVADPE